MPLSRHMLQRELHVLVFEKSEDGRALDARARKPPTSPTSQQFYRPWCHLGLAGGVMVVDEGDGDITHTQKP